MKRKILLAILPTFLVLSACQASPKAKDNNLFLEDTLAHEEVFSNVEFEERSLQPRRLDDPVEHPEANNFSIGVQSQSESAGCISFRFVAAVKFANSQLDPTEAKWTRTVSAKDGTIQKAKSRIDCTKAYKKLSNGSTPYSIDDYNDAHGLTGDDAYTHFVVYTIRNVPVEVATDYYVSAYLSLSTKEGQSGGLNLTSKAVAINASQTEKYVYNNTDGYFFMTGSFSNNPLPASSIRPNAGNNNKARFENVSLDQGETFLIKEFYDTELFIHGSNELKGYTRYYFDKDGNNAVTNFDGGTYDLILNNSNEIWTNDNPADIGNIDDDSRYLYYSLGNNAGWFHNDNCWVAVWIWGDENEAPGQWLVFSDDGNGYYKSNKKVDVTKYTTCIILRNSPSQGNSTPENPNWTSELIRISDQSVETATLKDCFYIYRDADNDSSPLKISWNNRNY